MKYTINFALVQWFALGHKRDLVQTVHKALLVLVAPPSYPLEALNGSACEKVMALHRKRTQLRAEMRRAVPSVSGSGQRLLHVLALF